MKPSISIALSACLPGLVAFAGAPMACAQGVPNPSISTVPSVQPATARPDTLALVTQRTPRGVRFVFHERGTGQLGEHGRRVTIRYTGFLPDGHVFDATAAAGSPIRFRVGWGEVIAGWDELLPQLPAGSRVRAWIPAALAYGAAGLRDPDDNKRFIIPPNTELVFELQVLSVR